MPSDGAGKEHVAGDLLLHETAVGFVLIEGTDHVIAIGPGVGPRLVLVVAMRFAVMDHIQPVPGPAFAVAGRGQQPIDQVLIGGRRRRRSRTRRSPPAWAAGRSGRNRAGESASGDRLRGDGVSFCSRSLARTKASMGLRMTKGRARSVPAGSNGTARASAAQRPPGLLLAAGTRFVRPNRPLIDPGPQDADLLRSQPRRPRAA